MNEQDNLHHKGRAPKGVDEQHRIDAYRILKSSEI